MSKNWKTKLIHSDSKIPQGYRSLASPTFRGSTTLFPSAAAVTDEWDQQRVGYTYGLYGTPTVLELAARVSELETGKHYQQDGHWLESREEIEILENGAVARRGPRAAGASGASAKGRAVPCAAAISGRTPATSTSPYF
jgi:hypothetical protein